jgi:hypothetical protein
VQFDSTGVLMGWVVYSNKNGEILRYYDTEQKASAQVNGHNKKLFLDILKNGKATYCSKEEWAYCNWVSYEEFFKKYYADNKAYMLNRSSYR